MRITLDALLNGKATKVKNVSYKEAKHYVLPFLGKIKDYDEIKIDVKEAEQAIGVYNRVHIELIKNNVSFNFVYGIDTKRPSVKIYTGRYVDGMFYTSSDFLKHFKFTEIDYDVIDDLAFQTTNAVLPIKYQSEITSSFEKFGRLIDKCIRCSADYGTGKIKLSEDAVISAYKSVDGDWKTLEDVYKPLVKDILNDKKDIVNQCEKILFVEYILSK